MAIAAQTTTPAVTASDVTASDVTAPASSSGPGRAGSHGGSPGTAGQARTARRPARWRERLAALGWFAASVGIAAAIWELAWAAGWLDPLLMPPPHLFLQDFGEQAANFGGSIGSRPASPPVAVLTTVLATTLRVLAGLTLGFLASLVVGIAATQLRLVGKLSLPTITLLAPISPIAWLPIAIFLFGIGNAPAVFMVFIGVFFVMTLATVSQIESLNPTFVDVARNLGANRWQVLTQVVLPGILPGLFVVLRLNLFAAWAIVLIAEAVGVGSGLGQVVLLARNTFNSSLVFFAMTVIGVAGFALDMLLRTVQRRLLWWVQPGAVGA